MATSGSFTTSPASGLSLRLDWTAGSQNVANNTTVLNTSLYLVGTYSISSSASKQGNITYGGGYGSSNFSFTIGSQSSGGWTRFLGSRSATITHNSDGTMAVALSAYADLEITISGKYVGRGSVSGVATLDTIPRASTFSSLPSSVAAGQAFNYNVARASSSFTHTIKWAIGSSTSITQTGIQGAGPDSWTVPLDWIRTLTSTATSGTISATLTTYNGSKVIGATINYLTLTVPDLPPTVNSVTVNRKDNGVPSSWDMYVQGISTAQIVTSAEGQYGATISSISVKQGSLIKTGSTVEFDLPNSGTQEFQISITDSRGQVSNRTASVDVQAYTPPTFTSVNLQRCTSSGTPSSDGTYASVNAVFTFSGMSTKNSLTTKVEYKDKSASTWINAGAITTGNTKIFGSAGISTNSQYDVRISLQDQLKTTLYVDDIGTAFVTMDFLAGGLGIAVGKVASQPNVFESEFTIAPNNGFSYPKLTAGANLNTFTQPGGWSCDTASTVAGFNNAPPNAQPGYLEVLPGQGVVQYWHESGSSTGIVWRRALVSGTWSPWKMSAGITDTGSNADGAWIRFPDGNQICYLDTTRSDIAINAAYGSLFIGNWNWTYPAAFTANPAVSCGRFLWGTSASWGTVQNVSPSQATLRGIDAYSRPSGTNTGIQAIAIGRWK